MAGLRGQTACFRSSTGDAPSPPFLDPFGFDPSLYLPRLALSLELREVLRGNCFYGVYCIVFIYLHHARYIILLTIIVLILKSHKYLNEQELYLRSINAELNKQHFLLHRRSVSWRKLRPSNSLRHRLRSRLQANSLNHCLNSGNFSNFFSLRWRAQTILHLLIWLISVVGNVTIKKRWKNLYLILYYKETWNNYRLVRQINNTAVWKLFGCFVSSFCSLRNYKKSPAFRFTLIYMSCISKSRKSTCVQSVVECMRVI